jgi:hypothetical protein
MSHKQSPIHRQEPHPRVTKVPPKRPYDYTLEENEAIAKEHSKNFFAILKKKQPEQPALDPEKVLKMLKNLHQPEPRLISHYDRNIIKSHNAAKRSGSSSASGKSVAQL